MFLERLVVRLILGRDRALIRRRGRGLAQGLLQKLPLGFELRAIGQLRHAPLDRRRGCDGDPLGRDDLGDPLPLGRGLGFSLLHPLDREPLALDALTLGAGALDDCRELAARERGDLALLQVIERPLKFIRVAIHLLVQVGHLIFPAIEFQRVERSAQLLAAELVHV